MSEFRRERGEFQVVVGDVPMEDFRVIERRIQRITIFVLFLVLSLFGFLFVFFLVCLVFLVLVFFLYRRRRGGCVLLPTTHICVIFSQKEERKSEENFHVFALMTMTMMMTVRTVVCLFSCVYHL